MSTPKDSNQKNNTHQKQKEKSVINNRSKCDTNVQYAVCFFFREVSKHYHFKKDKKTNTQTLVNKTLYMKNSARNTNPFEHVEIRCSTEG